MGGVGAIVHGGRHDDVRTIAARVLPVDDEDDSEDSEDHDPRRSKRARHGIDKLVVMASKCGRVGIRRPKCGRVGISATPPAASKYGVEICHVRMELERDPL